VQSAFVATGTTTWNGGFFLPRKIDPVNFLPQNAQLFSGSGSEALAPYQIDALMQVGADTLGVSL
jgi:hypothetical protein